MLGKIRSTLLLGFSSLPLLLISFVGFLAVGLGNISLFLLFIGHALVVPLITELLHFVNGQKNTLMTMNDAASLVPLMPVSGSSYKTPVSIYPTYWMAQIAFFFGYIVSNAAFILGAPVNIDAIKNKDSHDGLKARINARVYKAGMILGTSLLLYIVICAIRLYTSGTEAFTGILMAQLLFGFGALWYYIASQCGASNSDIFGISMQMMSPDSAKDRPKTCVYTGNPTGS